MTVFQSTDLILASSSPRRVELLQQLEVGFRVVPSRASELENNQLTAEEISKINAFRKALSVARQFPEHRVLGADTVVHINGRGLGKPSDLAEARGMLQLLQGRTHQVVTGVCLLAWQARKKRLFATTTEVTFHPLSAAEIEAYLRTINPLDKAGGYAVQEGGERIVRKISGSFSNVVGLPLEDLRQALVEF